MSRSVFDPSGILIPWGVYDAARVHDDHGNRIKRGPNFRRHQHAIWTNNLFFVFDGPGARLSQGSRLSWACSDQASDGEVLRWRGLYAVDRFSIRCVSDYDPYVPKSRNADRCPSNLKAPETTIWVPTFRDCHIPIGRLESAMSTQSNGPRAANCQEIRHRASTSRWDLTIPKIPVLVYGPTPTKDVSCYCFMLITRSN